MGLTTILHKKQFTHNYQTLHWTATSSQM